MEHPLTTLFHALADSDNPPIVELLDANKRPVGAIYFKDFKYKNFIITDTKSTEKYYLYVDGLGIYFSYHQKLAC